MSKRSREQHAAIAASEASSAAQLAPEPTAQPEPENEPRNEDAPRPVLRNEPRRMAMDEILNRDRETKGIEAETPEPEIPASDPTPHDPALAIQGEAAVPAPTPEPIKMVKVKVDGQEFEVAQTEVDEAGGVTAYQRDRASDNRLRKANETLAETRRAQAAIAQWIQQQTPQPPPLTDDQFVQSKVDVIRFGTPEESATALKEVMARSNPRVDPQAITQQAVSQMQQNLAVDNFKKEFQDVISNPMLLRLAVSLEAERKPPQGPQADWATFYRSIGNEVMSVVGRQPQPSTPAAVPATPTPDTPSPVDKEARKASIINLPTASARAALPQDQKPESREELLNSMRKSRGIPTG